MKQVLILFVIILKICFIRAFDICDDGKSVSNIDDVDSYVRSLTTAGKGEVIESLLGHFDGCETQTCQNSLMEIFLSLDPTLKQELIEAAQNRLYLTEFIAQKIHTLSSNAEVDEHGFKIQWSFHWPEKILIFPCEKFFHQKELNSFPISSLSTLLQNSQTSTPPNYKEGSDVMADAANSYITELLNFKVLNSVRPPEKVLAQMKEILKDLNNSDKLKAYESLVGFYEKATLSDLKKLFDSLSTSEQYLLLISSVNWSNLILRFEEIVLSVQSEDEADLSLVRHPLWFTLWWSWNCDQMTRLGDKHSKSMENKFSEMNILRDFEDELEFLQPDVSAVLKPNSVPIKPVKLWNLNDFTATWDPADSIPENQHTTVKKDQSGRHLFKNLAFDLSALSSSKIMYYTFFGSFLITLVLVVLRERGDLHREQYTHYHRELLV